MNFIITGLSPSDVGLNKVLIVAPVWHSLVINLGVPLGQVQALRSDSLGGLLALQYWRDGRSGVSYPSTWRFLLKEVEATLGREVAKDLLKRASTEPTWSQQKRNGMCLCVYIYVVSSLFDLCTVHI